MNSGFNFIQNEIDHTKELLGNKIFYTNEKMDKGFNDLKNDINNSHYILHGEVNQANEKIKKVSNFLDNKINDANKNMIIGFNNIKDDMKDVRNEIKENSFYLNNQISNLNNLYIQQLSKTNDEFRNQDKKIIQNEFKINEHEKTLNLLIDSNIKQKDKIQKHEIMLFRQQDNLMTCLDNVKKLYKESNEIKHNLIETDKKINALALKNEAEVREIKFLCNAGLEKVNLVEKVLNNHTEILTDHSTRIANIQSIAIKNSEKIDELCKLSFNHESRLKNLEGRVDKIEEILARHEEAIIALTGDVFEMKNQMKDTLTRIKKIENELGKIKIEKIEDKAAIILELLENMEEDEIYEFANFIIELRNMKEPFNLDDIMKGEKLIIENNKKKNKNKK